MIEIVGDTAGFGRLREEWNELLQASAADCLFLTWEWLYTWWKHLSGDRRLFVVAVRAGGELIAIAPLALCPRRIATLLPVPSLEFLGTGAVGSDYLDVIIRCGVEREALKALAACLTRERVVLELAQVGNPRSAAEALAGELKHEGWSDCRVSTDVCPYIRLAGHSWESYLASLGREHRYNFQRRLKNATKHFDLRIEQACSPDECRQALERLIVLHDMRWQGRGGSDAFHTPDLIRFHHEMAQVALDRKWLRLFVIWLDGQPAASFYGFRYRHVFYFYQSGLNPQYYKHSVGLLAMGLAIKGAIEEGAEEYDLLHGDEPYKFHWSREVRDLYRLEFYPPQAWALVRRQARVVIRAAKQRARQTLPKTVIERVAAARRRGMWKRLHGA